MSPHPMLAEAIFEIAMICVCRLFGEEQWSLEELRHRIGVVMPEEVARFEPHEIVGNAVLSSFLRACGRTRDMHFSEAGAT